MKYFLGLLCCLHSCLLVGCMTLGTSTKIAPPQQASAEALIHRLIPRQAHSFRVEIIPLQVNQDVFEIEALHGRVILRGSNGVAVASALNWYATQYCHVNLSPSEKNITLPNPLPDVSPKVRKVLPFQYRYCFNFCAFSYSLPWYDWNDWERMIDWMALHGINMPLAVTGQEAIWRTVYRRLGLTENEISDFLAGPAYLPFGWMGCLDGWGGPLPATWIDSHAELQKKIVTRERGLGMRPVLQGFTGHAPKALKRIFPQAKLQNLTWSGFPTTFVDPSDPLFQRIGNDFIQEQTRQYGTDHFYASDPFIEMIPPTNDPKFLSGMSRAIYQAMATADPEAVWMMQGWIFNFGASFWRPPQGKALLGAPPENHMILLDLACEAVSFWDKTEAFYGRPWIWGIVQTYGDQTSLHGGLPQINQFLLAALENPKRGQMKGTGFIMEGLGNNPIVWDFMGELMVEPRKLDLDTWITDYARRRYGQSDAKADEAWRLLLSTVYRQQGQSGSYICAPPILDEKVDIPGWFNLKITYSPKELERAWGVLLEAASKLGKIPAYQDDVVHVGRQVLANRANAIHDEMIKAYRDGSKEKLAEAGNRFTTLITDLDTLLATRKQFLLGPWLADAKRWATNENERRLYEWNAREIITNWSPDAGLTDYANKQWSGLLQDYYLPRWKMFLASLQDSLKTGKPFDPAPFYKQLRDLEKAWIHGNESYPTMPKGDPILISKGLYAKYCNN